jgi:hypothetical protein
VPNRKNRDSNTPVPRSRYNRGMSDEPDKVEVEHDGLTFRVHAPPIFANGQWTGKFACFVKGKGGSPFAQVMIDRQLVLFDTAQEAIGAGRSLISAKLSERPSLWRRIATRARSGLRSLPVPDRRTHLPVACSRPGFQALDSMGRLATQLSLPPPTF